jgi:hypothetical protein
MNTIVANFAQRAAVAAANCERNGHVLVGLLHTHYPHLYVVVALRNERPNVGSYTTWVMNVTQDADECLNFGHYDISTLAEAYADALDREHF